MFGRNLTGREQSRGSGHGFRGSSPPYPYIGRGRGGLPRCWYPGLSMPFSYTPFPTYRAEMTGEQELDLLKRQAGDIKKELGRIEARIQDLEKSKKE